MTNPGPKPTVALLFRGDREARDRLTLAQSRLAKIGAALEGAGLAPQAAVFDDAFAEEVRRQLLALDGVLVWVDPFTPSGDRSVLDALLREVAQAGVLVSAHPDTILKMGTKEVLHATREMEWGGDVRIYRSADEFRDRFPAALIAGAPRVLKQYRGNGGNGVFRVELKHGGGGLLSGDTRLLVRHARRGSVREEVAFDQLCLQLAQYFVRGGCLVDQPWQERMHEGMIRCYFVGDRVAGFGEQLVNALYPDADPLAPVAPGPRLYYPPSRPDFQDLRRLLESQWLSQMQQVLGVGDEELPVLWDADFFRGPRTAGGEDSYVLCEINISAVYPFPDEALEPLAMETAARLRARRA